MTAQLMKTLSFDSVAELGRYCRDNERCSDQNITSGEKEDDRNWDRGMDYDQAIETACKGGYWQEGADMMKDSVRITQEIAENRPLPMMTTSPDGFMPCVPHALMNLPNTMFKRPKMDVLDKPVVRIGVQMGLYWGTKADEQVRKGAAILTAVDQLEDQGYRCEIVCLWRASDNNFAPYDNWVNIEVTIKQPDDHWNPASAAFMIAHPAAQRRVMWKAAETIPEWTNTIRGGYCTNSNTADLCESMASDFDIWFGCTENTMQRHLKTEEKAFKYIQDEVVKQLSMMDDDTH